MKTILVTLTVFCIIAGAASAQSGGFGLGIMIGEPTGLSWKQWLGHRTALDGGVAWSLDRDASTHIHVDYLFHDLDAIRAEDDVIPVYYGIGGRIKLAEGKHDDWIGVRVPLGLCYQLRTAPLDFFVEVVPIMDLVPDTDFDLNAAIGVRYFFGRRSRSAHD